MNDDIAKIPLQRMDVNVKLARISNIETIKIFCPEEEKLQKHPAEYCNFNFENIPRNDSV